MSRDRFLAGLINRSTLLVHFALKWFISEETLLEYKPLHWCGWFIKRGLIVPKYFISSSSAPTVTDSAATSITGTSATGNGNTTTNGGATVTENGMVISQTSVNNNPLIGGTGVSKFTTGVVQSGAFTASMTSLSQNTGYSYKAYATNTKGTGYGTVQTFTTTGQPTVALNSPSDTATGVSTTPALQFTGTDPESDDITYEVQVDTAPDFHTFSSSFHVRIGNASSTQAVGQSFTTSSAYSTSGIGLVVSTGGSPTDGIYLELHSGSFGGTLLATSNTISATSLSSTDTQVFFGFPSAVSLSSSTQYYIEIFRTGAFDNINYCQIHNENPGTYSGGTESSYNGTTWSSISNSLDFIVYASAIDATSASGGHDAAQFSGTPDNTDPYASGQAVTFTVPSGETLTASTTYYWRVRGKDPSGSNTFGAWATTRSFTTASGGTPMTKTQSATARIAVNLTKTQSALARIAKNLTKTQSAIARVANNLTKTQSAVSRIANNKTSTQSAVARIQRILTKTQTGVARIVNPESKTQSAIARIAQNYTKTQSAISRIANNPTKTQSAVARIQNLVSKTQPATATIKTTVSKTQSAVSRVANNLTKTQPATARIDIPETKTQSAIARIANNLTKTQTGISRIANNLTKTQSAISRIANNLTATQSAVAKIVQAAISTKTQSAIARIANNLTATQSAVARIATNLTKTQSAVARIANSLTKTQSAIARIANNETKTQPATATIKTVVTKTQSAISRVANNLTKTQSATARIDEGFTKIQSAIARIANSLTKTQPSTARIANDLTKTQGAIARIAINNTLTQPAISRIANNLTSTQSAVASITTGGGFVKTQPAVSRIANNLTKTQSCKASILTNVPGPRIGPGMIFITDGHIGVKVGGSVYMPL